MKLNVISYFSEELMNEGGGKQTLARVREAVSIFCWSRMGEERRSKGNANAGKAKIWEKASDISIARRWLVGALPQTNIGIKKSVICWGRWRWTWRRGSSLSDVSTEHTLTDFAFESTLLKVDQHLPVPTLGLFTAIADACIPCLASGQPLVMKVSELAADSLVACQAISYPDVDAVAARSGIHASITKLEMPTGVWAPEDIGLWRPLQAYLTSAVAQTRSNNIRMLCRMRGKGCGECEPTDSDKCGLTILDGQIAQPNSSPTQYQLAIFIEDLLRILEHDKILFLRHAGRGKELWRRWWGKRRHLRRRWRWQQQ
jgi:hypothetical protein